MSAMRRWSTRAVTLTLALIVAPAAHAQNVVTSGYGHPDLSHLRFDDSYAGPYRPAAYDVAPLVRLPRQSEIVPTAWGHATYGIPSATGIRPASVGTPVVYVIDMPARGGMCQTRNQRRASCRAKARSLGPTPLAARRHTGVEIVILPMGRTASR